MEKLVINGGKRLGGEISVHGSKNAVLPIMAASLLVKGETVLHNVPDLSDVSASIDILEYLGAKVKKEGGTLTINAAEIVNNDIPDNLMCEMRSSIIFLGSLLARCRQASMCRPGGCDIGLRPIDLHLEALSALGAMVEERGSCISCIARELRGAKIVLAFPSVGATENTMIAAALAKGKTTIINAAREPEICDLADFLNSCGARISGAGEGVVEIEGVERLHSAQHRIIPDRILAATYMTVAALNSNEMIIRDIIPSHLAPVIPVYMKMGCRLSISGESLKLVSPKKIRHIRNIKTLPYPGFPTDCQALAAAVLIKARGTSTISEGVFENRFNYAAELNRLGADISVDGRTAIIYGVKRLCGAGLKCTDLRGGAAMVAAALAAEGESTLTQLYHIDRGYEAVEKSLACVGADIKRLNDEKKEC